MQDFLVNDKYLDSNDWFVIDEGNKRISKNLFTNFQEQLNCSVYYL